MEGFARPPRGAEPRPHRFLLTAGDLLRLLLVDAGLPEPVADDDIRDPSGRFVACADLICPGQRIWLDYEGSGHLERPRFEHDIDRFARLAEVGWDVLRLTREHVLRSPHRAVARTCPALERRR